MAIIPKKIFLPVDGIITATFDSGHAVGITSDKGIEILVHVGIDTVQMNGEGFSYSVEKGQRVSVGETLLIFDIELIKEKGNNIITPVVITNSSLLGDMLNKETGSILARDNLFNIYK